MIPKDVSTDSDKLIIEVTGRGALDSWSVLDTAMFDGIVDDAGDERKAVLLATPDDWTMAPVSDGRTLSL